MHKLVFVIIILLVGSDFLFSQSSKNKNKRNYEVTSVFKLDENVQDILYSSKNNNGINYPSIIIKSDYKDGQTVDIINDFEKKHIVKGKKKFEKILFSQELNYFSNIRRIENPTKDKNGLDIIEFYKSSGEKLFEKQVKNNYEITLLRYRIMDNGYLLGINDMDGIIQIYDKSENFVVEKKLLEGTGFSRMRGFRFRYTPDCNYIAVNAIDTDKSNKKFIRTLLLDIDLNIIFEKTLSLSHHGNINISDDGSIIIASAFGKINEGITYIFDLKNNKTTKIEDFAATHSCIFQKEDLVFLHSGRNGLKAFSISDGREIVHTSGSIYYTYDYAPETGDLFVLKGYDDGIGGLYTMNLFIRNIKNETSQDIYFGDIEYQSRSRCFISCTNDASKLILKMGDTIYTYEEVTSN